MNLFSIVIISILYVSGLIILYITYLAKKNREKSAFINNLINGLVLIFSITINLILIKIIDLPSKEFIVFPFNILMIAFICLYIPLFSIFIYREKQRSKNIKKKESKIENETLLELPLKYDLYRKITHLIVLGIIFFYFTLGFLVQNFFIYIFEFVPEFISNLFYIGEDMMMFTQNLVVFLVGISLIGLLIAEVVRIIRPEFYPLKPVNQLLREKELHLRLGPHISMSVGCFSIILLYGLFQPIGPVIICTSMVISIFGDISSNLVGRTIGRRKTDKTYEGLFAGVIIAFISGLIVLYLLQAYYEFTLLGLFLIPLLGALIIGLLDYINLEIDDNLSYNFCSSTILFFVSFSFL
ncbi:MAG: hypothetical protein ACFFBK_05470 [Promethearchaeota archaeon]